MQSRLLALSLAVPSACTAGWTIEDVDGGRTMNQSSLALTPDGRPLVAYGNDTVRLAEWTGSAWTVTEVDSSECGIYYHSLVVDASGARLLAYYDKTLDEVRLARSNGAAWQVEVVDRIGTASGATVSLALDSSGNPGIAYAGSGKFKLAHWDGVAWQIEDVWFNPGAFHASLVFDAADVPRIAWIDSNDDLRYSRRGTPSWIHRVVAPSYRGCSLRLDTAGNPLIAFDDAPNDDLGLARWDGSAWTFETVDSAGDVGELPSLALDPAGEPVIAYYDATNLDLKLARKLAGSWTIETAEGTDDVGDYPSLALDLGGLPLVSHLDSTNETMRLSRRGAAGWSGEVFDQALPNVGFFASLAIDPAGLPAVSYLDVTNRALRFARHDGSSWRTETVDDAGDTGHLTSLVFDRTGNPLIAYVDSTTRSLLLARWGGGAWTLERLDDFNTNFGSFVSLALDPAGFPAVAHDGMGPLELLRWDGSVWSAETLAARGLYGSLAFDAAGEPAIAHAEVSTYALLIARHAGSVWSFDRVDTANPAQDVSLVFDATGNPVISYHDRSAKDLELARWDGSAWQLETVEAGGGWTGAYASLALDALGHPAIAYSDFTNGDLKLARHDGVQWSFEVVDQPFYPSQGTGWFRIRPAFGPGDRLHIAYPTACSYALRVASTTLAPVAAVAYRGSVADVANAWKPAALPLTDANDDATPPFPAAVFLGAQTADPIAAPSPLVLYRVLVGGTGEAGNILRAVKTAGAVTLDF